MPNLPPAPLDPHRDLWFLGSFMRLHQKGADTGGSFTLVEQVMPAGFSPPLHVHEVEDTVVFVLEGRLTVQLGDGRSTVSAGESVFLPRKVPHTFRAQVPTRLLELGTPGGFDQFYAQNAVAAEALSLPPPAPPDLERLARLSTTFRTPLVGPPLSED